MVCQKSNMCMDIICCSTFQDCKSKTLSLSLSLTQISDVRVEDGGERLHLVHAHQILELPRREEESVSLLERHRGTELWLWVVLVVAQVGDLVEVVVAKLGGDEEEAGLEDVHGRCHGGRVEVLQTDLGHHVLVGLKGDLKIKFEVHFHFQVD